MSVNSRRVAAWRLKKKLELILYKGGKCKMCGYDKISYPAAFCFHHRDPIAKEFGIGAPKTISIARMKTEADKCDLLCVRCHAEVHDKRWSLSRSALPADQRRVKHCIRCACGADIKTRAEQCHACACKARSKILWPNNDELLEMLERQPTIVVARQLGVTDNAITKHLARRGIIWHRRG